MSDQTMFNEPTQTQATPVTSQSDPFVDKLMAIRNENGEPKYKSVEAALDALAESQRFIETLKSEKRTVEEQLEAEKAERQKMGNIEDFVKKISPNAQPSPAPVTAGNAQGLSEERVAQLFQEQLQARERETTAQRNLDTVVSTLAQMHGDKASAFITQKAQELNTTPAALKELAKSNPTMALTLLGGAVVKTNASPSQSSIVKPSNPSDPNPKPTYERGIARGGLSNKELLERFNASKAYTNKRIGLET